LDDKSSEWALLRLGKSGDAVLQGLKAGLHGGVVFFFSFDCQLIQQELSSLLPEM
jgi:hypothetical protein